MEQYVSCNEWYYGQLFSVLIKVHAQSTVFCKLKDNNSQEMWLMNYYSFLNVIFFSGKVA